jgi:hypothetical protein
MELSMAVLASVLLDASAVLGRRLCADLARPSALEKARHTPALQFQPLLAPEQFEPRSSAW